MSDRPPCNIVAMELRISENGDTFDWRYVSGLPKFTLAAAVANLQLRIGLIMCGQPSNLDIDSDLLWAEFKKANNINISNGENT